MPALTPGTPLVGLCSEGCLGSGHRAENESWGPTEGRDRMLQRIRCCGRPRVALGCEWAGGQRCNLVENRLRCGYGSRLVWWSLALSHTSAQSSLLNTWCPAC